MNKLKLLGFIIIELITLLLGIILVIFINDYNNIASWIVFFTYLLIWVFSFGTLEKKVVSRITLGEKH